MWSMDLNNKRLKPCTCMNVEHGFDHNHNDGLSNLPDELLIRILSLLPTKDAAAVCSLSKRLLRHVLPRITTLDIDSSPISFCLKCPYRIEQFSSFVTFVDAVLQAHQSQYLTRFKLGVGVGFDQRRFLGCRPFFGGCTKHCYPYLTPTQINAWITLPLTRCGLKELDLCIPVKEPRDDYQLPPEVFACETLEVLKLDVDLRFDHASAMPSFCLPNLKILELHASLNLDDRFLPRLISSCPLLEDLTLEAHCERVRCIHISSPSLRRLCFNVVRDLFCSDITNTDFVLIHTPNLEYLKYADDLALRYSISNMKSLVKAKVHPEGKLRRTSEEVSRHQLLRLIRPLSNVQHLILAGISTRLLDFVEVADQLPLFQNLKHLELHYAVHYWDKVLLAFLKSSPVLETLSFPQGIVLHNPSESYYCRRTLLEREFCKISQTTIPSCCKYYLKRILVKRYAGSERETDLIQFLLNHTLVLEDLIIFQHPRKAIDRIVLERNLQNLPRASITCSIQVQDETF